MVDSDERLRREKLIRAEYDQGRMSAAQIAAKLGITRNAVVGMATRMRLPQSPKRQKKVTGIAAFVPSTSVLDRGRPGETARAVAAVAARNAPKNRLCSWRTYEGSGRSMPCCNPAKPGHMWCKSHLRAVEKLRDSA